MERPEHLKKAFSKIYTRTTNFVPESIDIGNGGAVSITPTPNGDGIYAINQSGEVYEVNGDMIPILLMEVPNIKHLADFTITNDRLFYVGYNSSEFREAIIGEDGKSVSDSLVAKITPVDDSIKRRQPSTLCAAKMCSVGDKIILPDNAVIRVYSEGEMKTHALPLLDGITPFTRIYLSQIKPMHGDDGDKLILCGDYFIPVSDKELAIEKGYYTGLENKPFVMIFDPSTGEFTVLDDVITDGEATSFDTDKNGDLVFGVSRYNAPGEIIRYNPKTGEKVTIYDNILSEDGYNWAGSVTCLPNGRVMYTDDVKNVYCILSKDDVIRWNIPDVTEITAIGNNSVLLNTNTGKIIKLDVDK